MRAWTAATGTIRLAILPSAHVRSCGWQGACAPSKPPAAYTARLAAGWLGVKLANDQAQGVRGAFPSSPVSPRAQHSRPAGKPAFTQFPVAFDTARIFK